jgi:hypothetical protein
MDYNKFGFKNKTVDKFNNMYNRSVNGPEDPPKETDNGKGISKDDQIFAKVKATAAAERELEYLQGGRPTPAKDKRIAELETQLDITEAKKLKKTPGSDTAPTDNEIRIANANKILKEVEEMDKKAKKYGTINLRAYQEYRKEKMDEYYMLQSKIE